MRVGLLLLLFGCRQLLGFEEAAAPSDTAVLPDVIDAALCTELTSSCATPDVLRTCTALGELPIDTTCNWGCIADNSGGHCGELHPTGGAAAPADLIPDPALAEITLATGTINTDTGAITGVRPAGPDVMNGIGFEVRNGVAVFRFKKLSITGPVSALGVQAVVLVATEEIVVAATLVASGCASGQRSPGGSLGGGGNGSGPGFGGGGTDTGLDGGGGGAGHGVAGGRGGNGGGAGAGTAGVAYGAFDIPLLSEAGGSGGGGGADPPNSPGGAGGGAIQLISNTAIQISGGINAGGCGGRRGGSANAGGGGGSGGTIVLEAPSVEIVGGLAVNGGGGGGGNNGENGENGPLAIDGALGGMGGGGVGGAGGAGGAALAVNGAPGQDADRGGGGGGAVGLIRITTRTGDAPVTGFTSPTLGGSGATVGIANVQ